MIIRKNTIATVLAGLFLALAAPHAGFAQEVDSTMQEEGDPREVVSEIQRPDTSVTTFGNLLDALNSTDSELEALSAMTGLTAERVRVINADELLYDDNEAALDAALQEDEMRTSKVQTALGENMVIKTLLDENDVMLENVIAVDVPEATEGSDEVVVVFYRK